jgi:hypothetical protein
MVKRLQAYEICRFQIRAGEVVRIHTAHNSTAGNSALAIRRGDEYNLSFLFVNQL